VVIPLSVVVIPLSVVVVNMRLATRTTVLDAKKLLAACRVCNGTYVPLTPSVQLLVVTIKMRLATHTTVLDAKKHLTQSGV